METKAVSSNGLMKVFNGDEVETVLSLGPINVEPVLSVGYKINPEDLSQLVPIIIFGRYRELPSLGTSQKSVTSLILQKTVQEVKD